MRFLVVLIFSLCGFALPVHSVGLKENSVVSGSTITLGDVFYDLPRDEDRVLGAAPGPGKDMVLNARTLLRIARAMDLPWRPVSAQDHIVIRSDATIIDEEMIVAHLQDALTAEGVYGAYELEIPVQYQQITLPASYDAMMDVARISYDQSTRRFNAVIAAPSIDNPVQQVQISGIVTPVIRVPVMIENIQNGRIIRESDIDYITIREQAFNQSTIADAQSLVGMTARRVLLAGRPIREADIIAPQIIARGETVTLALSVGSMSITTLAKALQNGAKGDIIRVVNTSSNKTMQARVVGAGSVVVE